MKNKHSNQKAWFKPRVYKNSNNTSYFITHSNFQAENLFATQNVLIPASIE